MKNAYEMNKKVLVITPFFAPETHAAVFRAHKLVKYLKRLGWQPHVITVAVNYEYNEDSRLLDELKDIPIYRTKYIEPSMRGLKMAIGGSDRTYKTLKKQGVLQANNAVVPSTKPKLGSPKISLKTKCYNYVLNNYLKSPDRFWTWKKSAIKKAKEVIEKENIQIVYTTCLPFTSNEIGIELKKSCNIKWIADFRDPITYGKRFHSSIPKVYTLQRKIQDETFKHADVITGASSSFGLIFNDQYAGEYDFKYHFIPTGLDDDYLPQKSIQKDNTLVFVGEYLKEYEGHFFELFKKAFKHTEPAKIPKILIIGNIDINKNIALPYVKKAAIEEHVVFYDHMPQNELYKLIEKAKFTLLINGGKAYWWTVFAKMIDYIALEKRVLAFVPEISEAKKEFTKTNTAEFLKFDDKGAMRLNRLVMDEVPNKKINSEYCKRYLASSQVKAFIEIFEM